MAIISHQLLTNILKMRKRNSKTTITGQLRIKPLNAVQLEKLLTESKRPRDKDKIINRLKVLSFKK